MFISFFFLIISLIVLYGFSYISKIIYYSFLKKNKKKIQIQNIDLIYGLFFILFLLIILHFLISIKNLSLILLITGSSAFIYCVFKNKIVFNKIFYFLTFVLILLFITSSNGPSYDTQLYHHQVLNWNYEFKISINLVSVDDRLGMVSPWQLFLSLGNFKIFNSHIAYLLNYIPILLLFLEFFSLKKNQIKIPESFLILAVLYILSFSLIHPFQNGMLLMYLGSLGTDLAGAIFFILSIYYFLKFNTYKINKYFDLCIIYVALSIFCRVSYIPLLILPLVILINNRKLINLNLLNISIFTSFSLWLLRSILNNGCAIYPVKQTCLKLNGFVSPEVINNYSIIVKSFARTAPDHQKFMDIKYSIESFNWLNDWIINYFLKSSITQIFTTTIILFIVPFILSLFKKNKINNKTILTLIFLFLICLIIWLQAPDIRFALGFLISIPALIIVISLNQKLLLIGKKNFFIAFLIILNLLILKNFKNYNYNTFKNHKIVNNFKIKSNLSQNGFCYDINLICQNNPNKNFEVKKNKYNYLVFRKLH